jgi:hypothetical protein
VLAQHLLSVVAVGCCCLFQVLGSPNKQSWPGYTDLPLSSAFKWKTYPSGKLRSRLNLPSMPFGGIWLSDVGLDLLTKLLCCDPKQRITATDALKVRAFPLARL